MGAFSDLHISIQERKTKPQEWAVLLSDQSRPAQVWAVLGDSRGFYLLENPKTKETRLEESSDCWIVA